MARKLTVRSNPRRRRRTTTRRRVSAPVARRTRRTPARRRALRAYAPSRAIARPRRRRRSMASKKPAMTELLMYGVAGAGMSYGIEYALDRTTIISDNIESPTMQSIARTGVTAGVCALALYGTRKTRKRTQQIVQAGCIGAMSYSIGRAAKTMYDQNVATGGGEEQGTNARLPRGGTVVPMRGVGASARRSMGAPARRGVGYINPSPVTGTTRDLMPTSVDALDGIYSGSL